jgi:uncharacterized membrane protein YvbJ
MKTCKKCVKDYDETWGVCLLCGTKLDREKACHDACEAEGKTADEGASLGIEQVVVVVLVFIAVIALVFFFYRNGVDIWNDLFENAVYRGS